MADKRHPGLTRDPENAGDHSSHVLDAKLMKGEPPELEVFVRVEGLVTATVLSSPEVAEPDVIPGLGEDEGEAAGVRGDPAVGGAHHAVHLEDGFTLPRPGRDAVKLETVAILRHYRVTLYLHQDS